MRRCEEVLGPEVVSGESGDEGDRHSSRRWRRRRTVQAPTILGDLEPFTVPGNVAVTIGGKTANMEAWKSGDQLWFVFRDLTSADTTYPSARFLYTDAPTARRQGDDRLQPRAESAVRLQPSGRPARCRRRPTSWPCASKPARSAITLTATSNAAAEEVTPTGLDSSYVAYLSRSRSFSSSRPGRRRPWSFAIRSKAAAAPAT